MNHVTVYAAMADISAASNTAYAVVPVTGPLRRAAWALHGALAVGAGSWPVITVKKNGVATGETFSVFTATAGWGGSTIFEFAPGGVIFQAGDVISFESDGGPDTGAKVIFCAEFEAGTRDFGEAFIMVEHPSVSTLNEDCYVAMPVEGDVLGFSYAVKTATDSAAILTVNKNGVDTGETLTIPTTAIGLGAVAAPLGTPIPVRAGDVLAFDSDGGGITGGALTILVHLKRGPGRPADEVPAWGQIDDVGDFQNCVIPVCRRQRLRAVVGALKTAHTTPVAAIATYVDNVINSTAALEVPIAAEGGVVPLKELSQQTPVYLEPGGGLRFSSSAGGAGGDVTFTAMLGNS